MSTSSRLLLNKHTGAVEIQRPWWNGQDYVFLASNDRWTVLKEIPDEGICKGCIFFHSDSLCSLDSKVSDAVQCVENYTIFVEVNHEDTRV